MSGAHIRSRTGDLFITNEVLYLLSYASQSCADTRMLIHTSLERVAGIEPARPAWKAGVLPLNYTRLLETTPSRTSFQLVEGGGFEPPKLTRQIYSLIPLATREPLPKEPQPGAFSRRLSQERGILVEMVCVCKCLTRIFRARQFGTLTSKIRPLRDIFRVFHVTLQAHFGKVAGLRDIDRCLNAIAD